MEINLKVIQVLPLQSGVSKNSGKQWTSQMFIGETMDQYPRKAACTVFNPGQNVATPNVGDMITASFDLDSRSFMTKDGREMWSTDIRVWKIVPYDPAANIPGFAPQQPAPQQPYPTPQGQYAPQQPQYAAPQYQAPQQQPAPSNDLPF